MTTTLEHEEAQRQNTREQQNSYFAQNKGIYYVVLILAEVHETAVKLAEAKGKCAIFLKDV